MQERNDLEKRVQKGDVGVEGPGEEDAKGGGRKKMEKGVQKEVQEWKDPEKRV